MLRGLIFIITGRFTDYKTRIKMKEYKTKINFQNESKFATSSE